MTLLRTARFGVLLVAAVSLLSCDSGSGSSAFVFGTTVQVSGASSPLPTNCGNTVPTGTTETFTLGSAVQPQITAIPGGAMVGVWEQDRWTGSGARAALAARSTDGGNTWSTPAVLPFSVCAGTGGAAFDRTSDPWLTFAGSGVVIASALAFTANGFVGNGFVTPPGQSAVVVSRSTDGGTTWGPPFIVFEDANASGTTFYFNDRDSITADPATGNVYLVWGRLSNATINPDVPAYLSRSTDGGVTWSNASVLYDPGVNNEAFNNIAVVLPNGTVLDFFTLISLTTGAGTLQVVSSADRGNTWTATPVTVAPITTVGTPNPTPIVNGVAPPAVRDSWMLAQVAVDPATGNIAAVWQQQFSGPNFDGVALSVSKDGGNTWSTPVQINGAPAVAAFTPTVRYLPGSVLAVTYYDFRDYTSGSSVLNTNVWLTESNDGGATWHELPVQGPFDLNKAPLTDNIRPFGISPALFLGDNQGLGLVGSGPLLFNAATDNGGAHVYATQPTNPITSTASHNYKAGS